MTLGELSPTQIANVCRWALDLEPIAFGAKRAPRMPKNPRPLSTAARAVRHRGERARARARGARS